MQAGPLSGRLGACSIPSRITAAPGPARDQTLDLMRGLALLGVVVIHTFYRFAEPGPERLLFALPALLARPCIALFLFCSGYLTRPDGRSGPLLQRLKRLAVPYLFFSLLAYPFKLWVKIPFDPALIPLDLVMGNTMDIYYYLLVIAYTHLIGWWLARRGVPARAAPSGLLRLPGPEPGLHHHLRPALAKIHRSQPLQLLLHLALAPLSGRPSTFWGCWSGPRTCGSGPGATGGCWAGSGS